jgi:hypothetical protein
VKPVLDIPPMSIGCSGVIVPGSAWERYGFSHPEASVSKFFKHVYSIKVLSDVQSCNLRNQRCFAMNCKLCVVVK